MKLLFIIIFTFTLSLYSHEEHKINENNLLGTNVEGYQKLKISKNNFLSTKSDLDLNYLLQPALMDLDLGIEHLRATFYKSLPDGHYAAVYLDSDGNEIYWESLGDPFILSASHQHAGEEIIYFNNEAILTLKLYSNFKFSSIQIAYKNKNKINFYK
ncbi:hypothetical protein OAE05_04750 [Gammaproteobacteria bacterium]|nr:hypothetical protein [Gammaproteobacteria bacterium]